MRDDRDLSLDELIADAAAVRLPEPRSAPRRVIDLTAAAPRTIEIPEATLRLVEDYSLGV